MEAVVDNSLDAVFKLLKEGNHPDFLYGDTSPLQEAVRHNNFKMVQALVAAGADVNRQSHHALADLPLDIADSLADREIIEYLEDKGARSSAETRIKSSQRDLFNAVVDSDEEKICKILKAGVDPDFMVEGETTPLDEAIRRRNQAIVRKLVDAGADVNRVNSRKQAPLDVALEVDEETITHYLESEGAAPGRLTPGIHVSSSGSVAQQNAKPVFREETLKDIFAAKNWVGKTMKMEELWQTVPKRLKKDFDFAGSLSEARLHTLKQNAKKKFGLPPRPAPPAAG